jgi:hypothetical protein
MIAIKHCPPAEGLIATATYYIHQGKRKLGEESIQVFELPAHQGYHLQSALVLQWPLPHTQRITLELDPSWRPRATQIEFHAEGRSTRARYQIEGSQLWAALEVSGQRPLQLSCPWEEAVFDHPSALFAIALCKKSRSPPAIAPPSILCALCSRRWSLFLCVAPGRGSSITPILLSWGTSSCKSSR